MPSFELQTRIVGTNFRPAEAREILHRAPAGTEFVLVREPENQWDSNAIQVHCITSGSDATLRYYTPAEVKAMDPEGPEFAELMSTFLGFIPKTDNSALAAFLDAGKTFKVSLMFDNMELLVIEGEVE